MIDEELEQLKQKVDTNELGVYENSIIPMAEVDPVEEAEFMAALEALADNHYGSCNINWSVEGF